MNYEKTIEFLFTSLPMYQRQGAAAYKNTLDTSLAMDKAHGHPHSNFKSIHIAGTNGKGSVSHMLASILQSAGYKTGLYTSPHLVDFRERIRINGKKIAKKSVVDYVSKNHDLIVRQKPSFFEMTVDMAFQYFAKEKIDIAVLETGMGGRLDSTNIIDPILSIITNIGLDHTRFLGNNIPEIATEKAGIIKEKTPVIISEWQADCADVFNRTAQSKNSPILFADKIYKHDYGLIQMERKISHSFHSDNTSYSNLICDLKGSYQEKNIKAVLLAIDELRKQQIHISEKSIFKGMANVTSLTGLRGRWEEISYNPLCICDTAHNASGVKEIVKQLKNTAYKNLHIIWGMVSDKDVLSVMRLLPKEAIYYFTRASIPRALDEKELLIIAQKAGLKGKSYSNPEKALNSAQKNSTKEDLIYIGGSNFVVADIMKI